MEQEVLEAFEAYRSAYIARDVAAIEPVLHPDLAYNHSNALHETKESLLRDLPDAKTIRIELQPPSAASTVRVYGDMAILHVDVDFTNLDGGREVTAYLNVLHVFVRGADGAWRLLARQAVRRPVS